MKSFLNSMGSLLVPSGVTFSHRQTAPVVSTTFITTEEIDLAGLKVTIKTDRGESLPLSVTNAKVMKGLSKGDRVSLGLDVEGRVMKIVKITPDPTGSAGPAELIRAYAGHSVKI